MKGVHLVNIAALIMASVLIATVLVIGVAVMLWKYLQRHARRLGYPSLGAYLRAAPSSDEEKREAVNLALKGMVICLLGLVFPPFLLIGIFPLFYGARKVAWASMGLGLIDDAEQPGT
jgi:hypothetical protein